MSDRTNATHPATETRLQRARREGYVPKSQSLAASVQLLLATLALWWIAVAFGGAFSEFARNSWSQTPLATDYQVADLSSDLMLAAGTAARLVVPLGAAVLVILIFSHYLQTGPMFAPARLAPNANALSPGNWWSRVASLQGLSAGCVGLAKLVAVFSVGGGYLWFCRQDLFQASQSPFPEMIRQWTTIFFLTALIVALALCLLSIADFIIVLLDYRKRMRMTDQELREEERMFYGSPEIRRARKRQHQALANQRSDVEPNRLVAATKAISN